MHDIKFIRQFPEQFDKKLQDRGVEPKSEIILELDKKIREKKVEVEELKSDRNKKSKSIGMLMSEGKLDEVEQIKTDVAIIKEKISEIEEISEKYNLEINEYLFGLPNIILDTVPIGNDEDDNVEVETFMEPIKFDFEPLQHFELGENLGMMDFEYSSKISGARFVTLKGDLAKLERALGQYMLDLHTVEHGYEEVWTPVLVTKDPLIGTGQLPKFEEDLFKVDDKYYLIPTAEVTLTNIVANKIVQKDELPKRLTALTSCFRSEAGSAGRDTRGMLRQHQFSKVELVSLVEEKDMLVELDRMVDCAKNVLKGLKIPFRVVDLCTGDIGFSAKKTYDIEAWMPGQNLYREISSCSTCGDFQARRMKARYKDAGETKYIYTLNGSGVATGRALIAVMENYQNKDGSINVPKVLQKYMNGIEIIKK